MSGDDYIILEWCYTPEDFFEEPVYKWREDCEIHIEGGRVTATIDPDYYDAEHKKRDELHDVADAYFRAVQVVTHKQYTLSRSGMSHVYPDGRRAVTAFPETLHAQATVFAPDVRITNSDGNVVVDTRRERLEAELALAEAIGRLRPTDPLLGKLLDSYQAGVEDPDNELVHLYEVRDALSAHFSGDDKSRKSLGVPKRVWGRLGELANTMPLRQARHRGEYQELRNATTEELREAREIARGLIEAYVRYADREHDGSGE